MEGSNIVDQVAKTSGSGAAAVSEDQNDVERRKKVVAKDKLEYVVVSYKDIQNRTSYVSALPKHWIDKGTLWYPPLNKSEVPTQAVNKTTWRKYPIRIVYWDTVTKSRSQATSDAEKIRAKEVAEGLETSTESDVPQQHIQAKKSVWAVKQPCQPPSAPGMEHVRSMFKKIAPSNQRKRARSSSCTDSESERDPPRRSPRKHLGSNLSALQNPHQTTQGPSASEPTFDSPPAVIQLPVSSPTSTSQPTLASTERPVEDLPSPGPVTSPAAESTPKTAINNRVESQLIELAGTMARQNTALVEAIDKINSTMANINSTMERNNSTMASTMQSLADAVSEVKNLLDNRQLDTSSVANSSVDSVAVLSRSGLDGRLTTEQRSILSRTSLVTADDQQKELEDELNGSGRKGAFFGVLVTTLAERAVNKSDANKTANSVLRVLYDESYLAERVTMAGYKKSHVLPSGRDHGLPGKRFVALRNSIIYWAVFEAIKSGSRSKTTDDKIQKAIRDGVNTLRLHDKEKRKQRDRHASSHNDDTDQLQVNDTGSAHESGDERG